MEAILKFTLPEEEQGHRDALDGTNWKLVAWDIDQILRNALKHGCDQCEDNKAAAFEYIRKELWDSIDKYKLNLLD